MLYLSIAATKNKVMDCFDGSSEFSDEALTCLAKTAIGKPVLLDFNESKKIGTVVYAKNEDGELIIISEIDSSFLIDDESRIVPGFIVNMDEWNKNIHRIIKKAESLSYGMTVTPCEKDLPAIHPCGSAGKFVKTSISILKKLNMAKKY